MPEIEKDGGKTPVLPFPSDRKTYAGADNKAAPYLKSINQEKL